MPVQVSLKVVSDRFAEVARRVAASADVTARQMAEDVLRSTDPEVPVDEGELRASGHVQAEDGGFAVVYDSDHAAPVHNGHSTANGGYVAPRPFLLRGYQQAQAALAGRLRSLKDELEG